MISTPQPPRQDEPAIADADLDVLLAGEPAAGPGLRPVADVLAALTAGAAAAELAGEARALAEFRRQAGRPAPRRPAPAARLRYRLGARASAAATAVALLAGAATAAFADVLPAPIQRFAHETIDAPAPHPGHAVPGRGGPAGHRGHLARHPHAGQHRRAHGTVRGWRGDPHRSGLAGNRHRTGWQGSPHRRGGQANPNGLRNRGAPENNWRNRAGKHGNAHPTARRAVHPPRPGHRKAAVHTSARQGPSHAQGAVWRRRGGPGGRPSYSRPTAVCRAGCAPPRPATHASHRGGAPAH